MNSCVTRSKVTLRHARRLSLAVAALALAFSATTAHAQTDTTETWAGETSGDWNTASLWSPNNVPNGSNFAAVISATGGTPYTVTLDTPIMVDTATTDSADATLSLTTGTLQANTVNIQNSSTVNQTGGIIQGWPDFVNNIQQIYSGVALTVQNLATFNQSGGIFQAGQVNIADGTYEISNGATLVASSVNVGSFGSTLVLNGPGTIEGPPLNSFPSSAAKITVDSPSFAPAQFTIGDGAVLTSVSLTLGDTNNGGGGTLIVNTASIEAPTAIPPNATINMTAGPGASTVYLNGLTENAGTIEGSGTITTQFGSIDLINQGLANSDTTSFNSEANGIIMVSPMQQMVVNETVSNPGPIFDSTTPGGERAALIEVSGGTMTINGQVTSSGAITVQSGAPQVPTANGSLTVSGLTLQGGTVTIAAGSTLHDTGAYEESDTTIIGGSVQTTAAGTIEPTGASQSLPFGTLELDSTVQFNPTTPATQDFALNLVLGPASTTTLHISGAASGQYDSLDVTGSLTANGMIDLVLLNGFVPQPGESFTFITAASITGNPHFQLPALPAGDTWSAPVDNGSSYTTSVQATVVPEPISASMIFLSGLLLARRPSRRGDFLRISTAKRGKMMQGYR